MSNRRSYTGARVVATIFKLASFVVIVCEIIALAQVATKQSYTGTKSGVVVGTIVGPSSGPR